MLDEGNPYYYLFFFSYLTSSSHYRIFSSKITMSSGETTEPIVTDYSTLEFPGNYLGESKCSIYRESSTSYYCYI